MLRPRLRGLDEPYWLGVALITTGFSEMALGHHEVALARIREARELADRLENAWLTAISTFGQALLPLRWD